MPGLLSIQRFLLLALLVLAPALALAQTQQVWNQAIPSKWITRLNEAPVGTVNLFDVHRSTSEVGTGLKFAHLSECVGAVSRSMLYGMRNQTNGSGHADYFIYRRSDNVASNSSRELTLDAPATQHVTLNLRAEQVFTGEITLEMNVSMSALCSRWGTYRLARLTIKLLAQRNIRTAESLAAASVFRQATLASNVSITTGIVFQRGTARCPTNMTLRNHNDKLGLQHLNPSNNALTGALTTSHSAVAMGGSNARALALLFKAGATVSAGTLTVEVKVDSPASNNACPGAFATTITAKLTAAAGPTWMTGPNDKTRASTLLSLFNNAPTQIRIHRYAGTCETIKVVLPDNRVTGANNVQARVRDILQLNDFGTGSSGFDLTVSDVISRDNHVWLLLNNERPPAGTLAVTAVVSSGCASVTIEPLTMSFLLTVASNAWEKESRDTFDVDIEESSFAAPALAAASTPTPTGVRLHRTSTNCRIFDVAMRSGTGLGLLRMSVSGGTTTTVDSTVRQSFMGVHMEDGHADDNHFRLAFSVNASVGARTRDEQVRVQVSPSSQCPAATRPAEVLELRYGIGIRAGYRYVGPAETLRAASALVVNELRASATAVTTGIILHRTLVSCPDTSMSLLNHTDYLRLQHLITTNNSLTGPLAVSHANVPMYRSTEADIRALALLFKPRATVSAGTLTVSIRAFSDTTRSGCAGILAETITALVTLVDPTAWRAGPKARSQAASVLLTTEIASRPDTGIRFSHFTAACDDARLVLSDRAVTGSTGTARARSIARFSRYTALDVREPAHVGYDITVVNAGSNGYARLEMMGAPPAGTLTLEAVATPACSPTPPGVEPLTLSYVVTLADPLEWQTGSKSRGSAASVLVAADIGAGADTGIRFHSYTAACDRARLVLTDTAVGSEQARTIARLQRYTASDAKDGAAGPDLNLASLSSGVHAGLELMGTPPAGTLTFEVVATASCPSVSGIKPLTLTYQVSVRDASEAEQAVVAQETGAAATRVVGLSGIDAVLRRATGSVSSNQSVLELLAAKEELLESGDIDLRSFLAGQEFALGLDASATGRPGFGVWGRAEFLQLEEGEEVDPFRQEGDMFSAQMGADYRMAGGALLGLGYGRHELDTDYAGRTADGNTYAGNYVLALDVAQPYASLPFEGGHLAGAVAVGSGEAELTEVGADAGATYDADYLGWALGYRTAVSDGGLEIEGALSGGTLDIPDLGPEGSKADNMSMRAGVRYAPLIDMGRGSLQPSAGVALAIDWGDDPGHKYEFSAGLGYVGPRMTASAEYLFIGMDEGNLTASGGSIDVRFATAPGNLGLGLAATPAHGPAAGSDLLPDSDAGMRGSAEIGYGLAVDGGVLTPYGGWSFATEAGELGLRLRQGDGGSWLLRWREDDRDMIAVEFNLLGD